MGVSPTTVIIFPADIVGQATNNGDPPTMAKQWLMAIALSFPIFIL
jgi:hypothetical protein